MSRIKKKFKTKFFETMSLDDAVKIFEAHWRIDPGTVSVSGVNMKTSCHVKYVRPVGGEKPFYKTVIPYNVYFPVLQYRNLILVIDRRVMSSDRVLAITHSLDGGVRVNRRVSIESSGGPIVFSPLDYLRTPQGGK